jgi:stearoyl-CoA desaturase (delta-9 desaturase)
MAFFSVTALACIVWPLQACLYGVSEAACWLTLGYFVANGIAVTVGYHRLIAHRSFECSAPTKAFLLVLGASACSGSAYRWASDHIQHHAHTDCELDPYTPRRGFWNAQMGWIFVRDVPRLPPPRFLAEDALVAWQHRNFAWLSIATGLVLPFAVAEWSGLLLAGFVRIFVFLQLEGLINSWAHLGKHRPHDPSQSASDSGLLAVLTFGEGWHSYHHRHPTDYRLGVGALKWDPGKWAIRLLAGLGLATRLRTAGEQSVAARRGEAS